MISWFEFIVFRRDIVVGSLFGGHQFLGTAAPKITLHCQLIAGGAGARADHPICGVVPAMSGDGPLELHIVVVTLAPRAAACSRNGAGFQRDYCDKSPRRQIPMSKT